MTQLDFGFQTAPRPGIGWIRYPSRYGRADHEMTFNGETTGWRVEWCGHPTALRPYTVRMPDGRALDIYENGSGPGFTTFTSAAAAKIAAMEWRAGTHLHQRKGEA